MKVHYLGGFWDDGYLCPAVPACNDTKIATKWTAVPERVTCKRCQQTEAYQKACEEAKRDAQRQDG